MTNKHNNLLGNDLLGNDLLGEGLLGKRLSQHYLLDQAMTERQNTAKEGLIVGVLLCLTGVGIFVGLPLILFSLLLRNSPHPQTDLDIVICERGMVHKTNGEETHLLWQDVKKAWINIHAADELFYCGFTFALADGRHWQIGEFDSREIANVRGLMLQVQKQVGHHLCQKELVYLEQTKKLSTTVGLPWVTRSRPSLA